MNRSSPLLLISWSVSTVALSIAGAAVYVHLTDRDPVEVSATDARDDRPDPIQPVTPPAPPPPPLPSADLTAGDDVSLADVVGRVLPSVVNIATTIGGGPSSSPFGGPEGPRGQSLGSGVVVSEDGLVITNNHVVEGATRILVHFSDGHEYAATIIGTDELTDVALLRLTAPPGETLHLTPLAYGDSSALRLGDLVLAIGNPFGVGQTVTMGIVSAVGRADMGIAEYEDFIQTDASINPGNSGGALISMRGELIGINTAILSGGGGGRGGSVGIGFAIPTNMVHPIVDALLAHGSVVRGWLGVSIQDLDPDLASAMRAPTTQGVIVTDLEPGSPGAEAGLERGDIIERFGSERIITSQQLRNVVATRGARAVVELAIVRAGERRTLPVTLGVRPTVQSPRVPAPRAVDPRFPSGPVPPTPPGFGVPGAPLFPPGWDTPPPSAPAPPVAPSAPSVVVGGLSLANLDAATRAAYRVPTAIRSGAVIVAVEPGSSGEQTGASVGDVIVEVNRTPVTGPADVQHAYSAGGSTVLLLRRGPASTYVLMR
jgi:serine protease Do